MQDKKILNEFAAKITKAKILHDSTQATCDKLRREVAQLEKAYSTIRQQRESAENMEKALKNQLDITHKVENEASNLCKKEEKELEELRQGRKQLKREKDIAQHTLMKNNLQLEELTKKRQQLQATAKSLSDKLQGVTAEKEALEGEFKKTETAISSYNDNIRQLEQEIQQMRKLITDNTVPVHNLAESHAVQFP